MAPGHAMLLVGLDEKSKSAAVGRANWALIDPQDVATPIGSALARACAWPVSHQDGSNRLPAWRANC